ncbi:ABC transporter ATP-binding protein [Cellvibrio sp. KB43]|uniref:ABC transporter ATP-binding protein n=2 Tax=Cellvibrio polysaccharolyticus TaxID=2082724 RepID=A0A928V146_9GAMM|nr:ABC transporter ATP-binding protein [Cellvibrio polysaccharolyticus]
MLKVRAEKHNAGERCRITASCQRGNRRSASLGKGAIVPPLQERDMHLLDIHGLSFGYRKAVKQLHLLELSVSRGDMLGLLGPNGAGKTTLVSLIAGLMPAQQGQILLAGTPTRAGRAELALVPQEYAFYQRLTVRENLHYFGGVSGLTGKRLPQRLAELIDDCGLEQWQHQLAGQCSGGVKRRLNFAIGLLHHPQLLILDEPTANVDPQSRAFLLDIIRRLNQQGTTIVYTSHLLQEVEELCHTVAVLDQGRIVLQGSMDQLLRNQQQRLVVHSDRALPDALRQWPGISLKSPLIWEMNLDYFEHSSVKALALLQSHGIEPVRLQLGQGRLEEVFFEATRRELRE